jgi:anti-anti-sigma regulatory factor
MRDPLEGRPGSDPAPGTATTIVLNGTLDDTASHEVLRVIDEQFVAGAESIIVDLEEVQASNAATMSSLAEGLMSSRATGRHVQMKVRNAELHAAMATLPDARDWLLADIGADTSAARRAIHVDGPSGHA